MKVSLMISGLMLGLFIHAQSAPASSAPTPASAPAASSASSHEENNNLSREPTRNFHLEFQQSFNLKRKAMNGGEVEFQELKKRCELGVPSSCSFLGDVYLYGPEKMNDLEKGLYIHAGNCDSGDGGSCESLYIYYSVEAPDSKKAELYCRNARQKYMKACEHHDGESCFPLGFNFDAKDKLEADGSKKPRCFERNLAEAAKYYQMACDNANDSGCINLSRMYRDGDAPTKDAVKENLYYDRGLAIIDADCLNNDAQACSARGRFFKYDGHPEESKIYYRKACDLGDVESCEKLKDWDKKK